MKVYCFSSLLYAACAALFAFLLIPKFGLYGFIWSIVLANICGFIYSAISIRIHQYIGFSAIQMSKWKEMIDYALPLIPNATIWWVISSMNRPFMEHSLGLAAIGLFAVANKFPTLVSTVFGIFSNSWQISVLQEYHTPSFKDFYSKMSLLYIPLLILISCLLALFSEFLVSSFVDIKFYEAWKYVPIISLAVIGMGVGSFVGSIFSAVKKSKYYLYPTILGGVLTLVLNFLLIPWLGLWGASLSFVLSHFSICLSRVYYSHKIIKNNNWLKISLFFLGNIALALLVIEKLVFISWCVFIAMICVYFYFNYMTLNQVVIKLKNKYSR